MKIYHYNSYYILVYEAQPNMSFADNYHNAMYNIQSNLHDSILNGDVEEMNYIYSTSTDDKQWQTQIALKLLNVLNNKEKPYDDWNPPNIPGPANPAPYEQGWVCPKCGRVLAPWARSCECSEKWEVTCSSD